MRAEMGMLTDHTTAMIRPRPKITLRILKDFTRNPRLKMQSYFWTLV